MKHEAIQDLNIELSQLSGRIENVKYYFDHSQELAELSQSQQDLLALQYGNMVSYAHILRMRINDLEKQNQEKPKKDIFSSFLEFFKWQVNSKT